MRIRVERRAAAVLGLALALTAAVARGGGAADERVQIRADYERDLARLRMEHQKRVAEARLEQASLERKVDTLRRMVPAEFDAAFVERRLRSLADAGEMARIEVAPVSVSEKVRLADGADTPYVRHVVDVTGEASHAPVAYFLDRVGRLPQVVELTTLSLDPAPLGTVRFAARLGFPVYAGWPEPAPQHLPAPTTPFGPFASIEDERTAREKSLFEHGRYFTRLADVAREPVRRLQAEIFAIAEMKKERAPVRFHAALARLDAGLDRRMVSLGRARFGPRNVIEGIAVGAPARTALKSAFEGAGFLIDTWDIAPAGDCRAFTLAARLTPYEDAGVIEPGEGRFEARSAATCNATVPPAKGSVVARGTSGPLDVRVRDIDIGDVFRLLSPLTGESFVVDADVTGRVNVELERATLDEALAAMGAVGVAVGPGPLRRVSRAGVAPEPFLPPSRETTVSLSFKDGPLADVARLFQDVSGRKAWTAPVMNGGTTIYALEVPWDTALRGIAASVGMTAVIEDDRFFVGPVAMAQAPWRSGAVESFRAETTEEAHGWGRIVEISKVSPEDLTPIGLARTAAGPTAIAYGPGRLLWVLEDGVEMFGARVGPVGPADVTFVAGDGRRSAVRFAP
jgi:hypothetical protein